MAPSGLVCTSSSYSANRNHMNELALIERIRELRHEISETQSANRDYWSRSQRSQEEKNQNERRRERLQEIKEELPTLVSVFRTTTEGL
jgi:phage regulator Rha-like protein